MVRTLAILLVAATAQAQGLNKSNGITVGRWIQPGFQTGNAAVPTKALDVGTMANHGTCTASPTYSLVAGRKAMTFAGSSSQYVNMGNVNSLNLTNLYHRKTVSCWVRTSTVLGNGNYAGVVGKGYLGNINGYGMGTTGDTADSGKFFFQDRNLGADNALTPTALNDGRWHHVVGVVDVFESKVKIYTDGILASEANITHTQASDNNLFGIGARYSGSWSFYFTGQIDDVRVWNFILSPEEIKKLYRGQL